MATTASGAVVATAAGTSGGGGAAAEASPTHSVLEQLARALIREELLRSGCERTLEAFDAAAPADEVCFRC